MELFGKKRQAVLEAFEKRLEDELARLPELVEHALPQRASSITLSRAASWFSAGICVLALGIYAGAEIRSRYRFKRLTPYDFYSHSGARFGDADLSLGV